MEEEGVTLGEIFRTIGRKIWIILGVSALVAIIAVLVVNFALNPSRSYYSMDFRIIYPTSDSEKYPDGTPFYYTDMISKEFMEEAKATDPEGFASVDVDRILRGDKITISAETDTVNGVRTYTGRYTVTVQSNAFKNAQTASDFITALANVPVEHIKTKAQNIDFVIDQNTYQNASFAERISLLREMKNTLLRQYEQWIGLYRESYPVEVDGTARTLENLKAEVSVSFGDTLQATLQKELERNGFDQIDLESTAGDLGAAVTEAREMLAYEQELNENIIAALLEALRAQNASGSEKEPVAKQVIPFDETVDTSTGGNQIIISPSTSGLSELLASYTERNAKIAYQIGAGGTLTYENAKKYGDRLDSQYRTLTELAGTLTKTTASIYGSGAKVLFDSQTINVSGTTNIAVAAVAGFVLAFLVCAVVVCAVGMRKNKQKKQAAQETASAEKTEEEKEQK